MSVNLSKSQTASYLCRLEAARRATESAGAALMALRGTVFSAKEAAGGQLKTAVDQAAEGWVLGYLRAQFPKDSFLCEELFEQGALEWDAPGAYWTIDALDGTRSFVEGFDGFCVQVAYVQDGKVQVAVVHEPVRHQTYWALIRHGTFVEGRGGHQRRLLLQRMNDWPSCPRFVDSTSPTGIVGEILVQLSGEFLECGSIGLKICRVADSAAHVFAKEFTFKLWDIAPGDLILSEAGGRLGLWAGEAIPYDGRQVYFKDLLASPAGLFELMVQKLARRGLERVEHLH